MLSSLKFFFYKIVNLFLVVVTMLFVSVVNVKADENLDAMFEKIIDNLNYKKENLIIKMSPW